MINLGDVNFSLGADTARLQQSIRELNNFANVVSRVSQIQTRAGNQAANALRRQEKAAGDAFIKVQNLNNAMGKMQGTERFIRANETAFARLNSELTRGQLTSLGFQRAMERFNQSVASTQRNFSTFKAAQQGLVGDNKNLVQSLQNVASGFVLVNGPLGGLATRIVSLTAIVKRGGVEIAAFIAGMAAGFYVIQRFGREILEAGKQVKSFEAVFLAVTGSVVQAWSGVAKATEIARRTGTLIEDIAPGMARFEAAAAGVGLSGAVIRDTFETIAAASTKLQLGSEQTRGVFRALEQIMSKGTLQAEELRGQLGDRLPGAFQIAARAMGVTTSQLGEMMKKGLVPATEFIPKFIEELKKTFNIDGKPIDNYTAAVNNMNNAWFQLRAELDRQLGISDRVMQFYKQVTGLLDFVRENLGQVKIYAIAATAAFVGLAAPAILGGLVALSKMIVTMTFQMGALNRVIMANPFGLVATILARLAIIIGTVVAALWPLRDEIHLVKGEMGSLGDYMRVIWRDGLTAIRDFANQFKGIMDEIALYGGVAFDLLTQAMADANKWMVENTTISMGDVLNVIARLNESIPQVLAGIPNAVALVVVNAINWMLQKLEDGLNVVSDKINEWIAGISNFGNGSLGILLEGIEAKRIEIQPIDTSGLESKWQATTESLANTWKRDFAGEVKSAYDSVVNYGESVRERANRMGKSRLIQSFRQSEFDSRGQSFPVVPDRFGSAGGAGGAGAGSGEADSKAAKKLKQQADAIENINRAIERTYEEVDALGGTEAGLRALTDQFKREDEVRKYARAMEKAGVATDIIKEKSAQLLHVLEMKDVLEKAREALMEWQGALTSAFDQVSSVLVDAVFDGGESLKKLPDVAKAVAKDIFNTFLQLSVMNPLKNMLFGTNLPTTAGGLLGGLFGSGGGGGVPFTPTPGYIGTYRRGGIFGGMGPITKYAAAGRLLTKPTQLLSNAGPIIGGEAGTEAIMPLQRDSSGRLGVRANGAGGGNSTSIKIFNQRSEDTDVKVRETEGDNGEQMFDIVIGKTMKKFARGDADPIFATRFNVKPATRKRT